MTNFTKSLSLVVVLLLSGIFAFGQVDLSDIRKRNKKDKKDYKNLTSIYILSTEQMFDFPEGANPGNASWGLTINNYFKHFRFGESRFGLSLGTGFKSRNYFSDVNLWTKDTLTLLSPASDYTKNKLSVNSITLPIELTINGKPNENGKRFRMAVGILPEYIFDIHTKTIDKDGLKSKFKGRDDLNNINRFRYGATARISYGWFGVVGNYGLMSLFGTDGPDEYVPWSVGIQLIGL